MAPICYTQPVPFVKTLHLYLTRQVLGSLLMTVVVFTFVLLLGSVLKELMYLLFSRQASLGLVVKLIGLLIPFSWVFALPMGMLTATLLVFGRFSADQELTAARASGISLISLMTPVILLSLVLCGVCAMINLDFGPRCRVAFNNLRFSVQAELSSAVLPEGRYITDFPGFIFYVTRNKGGNLEDITVYKLQGGTNLPSVVHAPRGLVEKDTQHHTIMLHLYDIRSLENGLPGSGDDDLGPLALSSSEAVTKPPLSDMTFWQLRAELRDLRTRMESPPAADAGDQIKAEKARALMKIAEERVLVNLHRQVAFSFACFGFTLVGIPLGIRVHRRETNAGVAMAIGLVLIYYSFIAASSSLASRSEWSPHLLVWVPNFLFQLVGAVLLWRANRGI